MRALTDLLLATCLLVLPFAVREWVHWRSTLPGGAGRRGSSRGGQASNLAWMTAYVLLLGLGVGAVTADAALAHAVPGLAVLWAGALLRCFAYRALGAHYAMDIVVRDGHRVIDAGPYRWLRHPLHLGLLVEITGLWLVAPTWWSLLLPAAALAALLWRNRDEERVLLEALGEPYRIYRARTWDLVDLLPGAR